MIFTVITKNTFFFFSFSHYLFWHTHVFNSTTNIKLVTFYTTTNDYNEKKRANVPDIPRNDCQTEKWCKVIYLVLGTQKHLEKCWQWFIFTGVGIKPASLQQQQLRSLYKSGTCGTVAWWKPHCLMKDNIPVFSLSVESRWMVLKEQLQWISCPCSKI